MIAKMQDKTGNWFIYDDVRDIKYIYKVDSIKNIRYMEYEVFRRTGKGVDFAGKVEKEPFFLLNDQGKTIEKIN